MKTILCYGDSNTWGAPPGGSGRHAWNVRWPGFLQELLGSRVRIIEEGLGGRTTCFDDPLSAHRNGLAYLSIALESHSPIDLLIVMLGTNDLKVRFNLTPYAIGQGAAEILKLTKTYEPAIPSILLVSPPHVVATEHAENTQAFEGAVKKSQELATHYSHVATQLGCHFFDASSVAKSSEIDGIHLDEKNHELLARGMAKEVQKIFRGQI